jgi:hypothetical protein
VTLLLLENASTTLLCRKHPIFKDFGGDHQAAFKDVVDRCRQDARSAIGGFPLSDAPPFLCAGMVYM